MTGVPTGPPGGNPPPPPAQPQVPPPAQMQPKKPNSGKAIASMVLGILGTISGTCGGLFGGTIAALIFGAIALYLGSEAKKDLAADPNLGGDGMAKAGWILAIISLVLGVLGTLGWIILVVAAN